MSLEIEIKLRVDGHAVVRSALEQCHARLVGKRLETNTFLDWADSSMRKAGQGLRVRRHQDIATGDITAVITHKGQKQPGEMKVREETEIGISSYNDGVTLLTHLGLFVKLSFEKKREIWELGDCEVVLDELPENLGRFVEIEGPEESAVRKVQQQLGLASATAEGRSYAAICGEHLAKSGREVMTFAD